MADRRNSWVKNYEDVDFDVPFLSDQERRSSPDPGQPTPPVLPSSLSAPSLIHTKPSPSSTFPRGFQSSPLNPTTPLSSMPSLFRPASSASSAARITRIASEECRAFSTVNTSNLNSSISRGSMILYRQVDPPTPGSLALADDILLPPLPPPMNRSSLYSTSGDSYVSISSDSKYPITSLSFNGERGGLVAYAYDPELDERDPPDEEDMLHDPAQRFRSTLRGHKRISPRGVINIATLVAMVMAVLCLFVGYPVIAYYRDNGRSLLITGNTKINSTGQAFSSSSPPTQLGPFTDFIDPSTPQTVYSFVGTNDITYNLVFSYEFNSTGQTFRHTENIFWVARDKGFYSPSQVTTGDGQLSIRIDPLTTTSSSGQFVSGMLDSQVPFCVGHGFVEVGIKEQDGTIARVFWAGEQWSYTNAAVENHVPAGPSLNMDVSLSLSIGVLVNKIQRNTSPDQLPQSVTADYVRFYQTKVHPSYARGACDVQRSAPWSITLDLLNIPR